MTITSSAPPNAGNAVPARVTGHAGPRQNIVMPQVIAQPRPIRSWVRRPRRSTTRTPQKPGSQRRETERRSVQRGDHAGEMELLAELTEHDSDAEPPDEQRVSERGGVGEPIPPEPV